MPEAHPVAFGRLESGEQLSTGSPGRRRSARRRGQRPAMGQHEGALVGERVREGEVLVAHDYLGFAVMACDEIHIERARTPPLFAYPLGGSFEVVRATQPAMGVQLRVVGDQHGVEERPCSTPPHASVS